MFRSTAVPRTYGYGQFMDRLVYSAYTVGEITESDIRSALIGIDYSQCNFNSSNIVYLTTSA